MNHRSLSGWPLVLLCSLFALLLLMNGAVLAYRQSGFGRSASRSTSLEARVTALERELASLKARQANSSLERFNEVRVNGKFVGFRERDGSLIQGVMGPGYSDMPVGSRLPPTVRNIRSGRGIRP
jgi:hypothetical protein